MHKLLHFFHIMFDRHRVLHRNHAQHTAAEEDTENVDQHIHNTQEINNSSIPDHKARLEEITHAQFHKIKHTYNKKINHRMKLSLVRFLTLQDEIGQIGKRHNRQTVKSELRALSQYVHGYP